MAKHVVMNLKKVPIKVSGLEMVEPPELSFKIEVELDRKIEKEASKDPLLQQEFQAQASDILDQTKKTIEQKCKVFDKLIVGMVNKGADKKEVEKQLKGLNEAIKNDMAVAQAAAEQGVQKTWKDLQSKRKEWRSFKIKVGVSITGTLAGLTVSIVGLATSGFTGGASGVMAIAGFIKAGITLAQDIKKLAIGIEAARKELEGHLTFVEAAADKRGMFTTNEVSAAVLNEFIGISQPSIKSIQDCTDTIKAKYAQMIVKVHDLSKTLDKLLKEQEKVKKEFLADVAQKLKKHPVQDKARQLKVVSKQLDDVPDPNYKKVEKQVTRVQTMYADARGWAPVIKDLARARQSSNSRTARGSRCYARFSRQDPPPPGRSTGTRSPPNRQISLKVWARRQGPMSTTRSRASRLMEQSSTPPDRSGSLACPARLETVHRRWAGSPGTPRIEGLNSWPTP